MSTVAKSRNFATFVVAVLATLLLLSSCIVESPTIETTGDAGDPGQTATPTAVVAPPTAVPQFEPTAEPTAVVEPTPTEPAVPTPTATPELTGPTPLPTSAPADEFLPVPVAAGTIAIPIARTTFILANEHPILQLGGHTLIYLDDQLDGEVDIFTPRARPDGTLLSTYADVIAVLESEPALAGLDELDPVSIAGLPTRVFEGTADSPDATFITEPTSLADDQLGWFPPKRMRLWVIDHPDQPIIVSAESLEDPGRYSESIRLATEILSTIDFG